MCIQLYMYTYNHIYICTQVCIYKCIIYIFIYLSMYIQMHYIYIYIYMYIYIYRQVDRQIDRWIEQIGRQIDRKIDRQIDRQRFPETISVRDGRNSIGSGGKDETTMKRSKRDEMNDIIWPGIYCNGSLLVRFFLRDLRHTRYVFLDWLTTGRKNMTNGVTTGPIHISVANLSHIILVLHH